MGQAVKPACSRSHAICFTLVAWAKSMSAKDNPDPRTSRMVGSTEFLV